MSFDEALQVVDLWMGDPPWEQQHGVRDILYTQLVSIDDNLIHRVRMRDGDVLATDQHFNLEAGTTLLPAGLPGNTYDAAGNFHLRFTS